MLRILCHIRTSYPPKATSGADIMCERINTYLASKGCEVKCVVDFPTQPYEYKGVQVISGQYAAQNGGIGSLYAWADIVITHLINRSESTAIAARYKKPLFHVCHNDNTSTLSASAANNYVIYNSEHLMQASPVKLPGIVVNPPTWIEEWEYENHFNASWHTLVNCVDNKGGEMLYQLACELPTLQFRGIRGGYGNQIEKSTTNRNLMYRPYSLNMQEVYRNTRVLLVPSIKESWSLCAAEAQACGIPVVCSDLPGLRENMGDTAIYCHNKREFLEALIRLQDIKFYTDIAFAGRLRAKQKNHAEQLDKMFNFMCMKAGKGIKNTFDELCDIHHIEGDAIDNEKKQVSSSNEKQHVTPSSITAKEKKQSHVNKPPK